MSTLEQQIDQVKTATDRLRESATQAADPVKVELWSLASIVASAKRLDEINAMTAQEYVDSRPNLEKRNPHARKAGAMSVAIEALLRDLYLAGIVPGRPSHGACT